MAIWNEINDTLSAIGWIGWPLAIVVVLAIFRRPIGEIIGRINNLELFGNKFEMAKRVTSKATEEYNALARSAVVLLDEEERRLNAELRRLHVDVTAEPEVADEFQTVESPTTETPVDPASVAPGAVGKGDQTADSDPARGVSFSGFSREQVETFVKAAAEAGYEIGSVRMFQGEVEPVIEWTEDNVPEIKYWKSKPEDLRALAGANDPRVKRLEAEIKQLAIELNEPMAHLMPKFEAKSATLRDLKDKLRFLDPASPWA